MLHTITHGERNGNPGLLIAHGLYGSARNWGAVAKALSGTRQVVAADMRNHGLSPWKNTHSYEDMAADLAEVIESLDGPFDVLGHSMGGKAAMVLALTRPALVNRLIVADIAPVPYSHSQMKYIEAMKAVDPTTITRRSDAEPLLAAQLDDPAVIPFFLQSLDLKAQRWLLNLDVLAAEMPKIMDFPEIPGTYEGPALFLSGTDSDYVGPESRSEIKRLFPAARFMKLTGAGHWLHAEKPREFVAAVRCLARRELNILKNLFTGIVQAPVAKRVTLSLARPQTPRDDPGHRKREHESGPAATRIGTSVSYPVTSAAMTADPAMVVPMKRCRMKPSRNMRSSAAPRARDVRSRPPAGPP